MFVRDNLCFKKLLWLFHDLVFDLQPHLDAPVKWSERTALTDFFWERIQNCMSSQAQAWSQSPSYSLSTKWHASLWTQGSVSVSSSDTLPGRRAAFQGATYNSAHEGGIQWRWRSFSMCKTLWYFFVKYCVLKGRDIFQDSENHF